MTRATVIDASPLGDLDSADAWLARALDDDAVVDEALALLNRAVAGYRIAAADPWIADAAPGRATVCRVGYGTGEQVAEKLVLSSETVKTHIRNAMTKLEASTRVHAIAIALREGYIQPPSSDGSAA